MADIELVIKISEEDWEFLKASDGCRWSRTIIESVINGTPLPKGHGRLIDADELKKHKYHDNDRFENAVAIAQIDWAKTIIPADKEEK